MRPIKLLCDTNNMCYGSSSALLAICSHIPGHKTALAWGITKEILEKDPAISNIIEVNLKEPAQVAKKVCFEEYDAVLVISNLSNLDTYLSADIPVFFVDILYWYHTPKNHIIWKDAVKCFIEKFPGVQDKLEKSHQSNAKVVGPIIRCKKDIDKIGSSNPNSLGTLVNIGGASSRWIKPGINTPYPQLVFELINSVKNLLPSGEIVIAGGNDAINQISENEKFDRFKFCSLSQIQFLNHLDACDLYITAPGLNAVMEGIEFNKPIVFLPPQNASQVLQLSVYEQMRIAPRGLNLNSYTGYFEFLQRTHFDEKQLTYEVLESLSIIMNTPDIISKLTEVIAYQVQNVNDKNFKKPIQAFKETLWPLGSSSIADEINYWWNNEV